jgi:hypothetical protein
MDGAALQDLVSKGDGIAARRTGVPYIVYRSNGPLNPIISSNRIIKLFAAFAPIDRAATGTNGYSAILWRGVFDSHYTAPGDYLLGPNATFFIASQWPAQPVLCVKPSNIVTISRPQINASGSYSGFVVSTAKQLISSWPALLTASGGRIPGTLPESHFGNWTAFLPALPNVPQIADVLTDDLGRCFVVGASQLSDFGWRLAMRQVDG